VENPTEENCSEVSQLKLLQVQGGRRKRGNMEVPLYERYVPSPAVDS
jgi:hypothetical protein